MDITHCLNDKGDFTFGPRHTELNDPRYMTIFDEDGNLQDGVEGKLRKLVKNNGWSPWCEAVGIIHAQRMTMGIKGNYPAITYFR